MLFQGHYADQLQLAEFILISLLPVVTFNMMTPAIVKIAVPSNNKLKETFKSTPIHGVYVVGCAWGRQWECCCCLNIPVNFYAREVIAAIVHPWSDRKGQVEGCTMWRIFSTILVQDHNDDIYGRWMVVR